MRQFSLDMIPGGAQTAVACNQYEAGDTWIFALYYDGGRYSIPEDAEVSITGTKPDGAAYKVAGTVTDNAVVIEVTEQMTACAGRSIAEILVESETDGTTLYSANFPLLVEPAAVQGELSPSVIPTAIVDENGNVYYEGKSIMGLYPVESASGDVAVIHDGADDLPVRDLSVAIEPVQSLNGYDKPWAGGAGKNQLTPTAPAGTVNGITYTVNSDGSIKASGTATAQAVRNFYNGVTPASVGLADGEYILSGCPSGGSNDKYALRVVTTKASGNTTVSDYGSGATFTIDSSVTAIRVYLYVGNGQTVNNIVFYPMIRKASETDATYEPYSNICPISGWDAVKVMRTGANLMPPANVKGTVTYSGITYEELGDGRYRIYGTSTKTDYATYYLSKSFFIPKGDGSTYLLLNNSNQNSGVKIAFVNGSTVIDTFSCNTPYRQTNSYSVLSEKEITGFRLAVDNGTTCDIIVAPMFVPADEYENHSIDLPTTVYGGTLDVTTGILTVTKGLIASYAGETLPGAWISDRDVYAAGTTPTTGAQVVYDLASHQTYTLTPTEVKTLLGENRIYADAGDVTVEYRVDFNEAGLMYIPKAPTADGTYRLAVDVTGGTSTYKWEAAE